MCKQNNIGFKNYNFKNRTLFLLEIPYNKQVNAIVSVSIRVVSVIMNVVVERDAIQKNLADFSGSKGVSVFTVI